MNQKPFCGRAIILREIGNYPRCDFERNRRFSPPDAVLLNLASCLVMRPCVRRRHNLKELGLSS